MKWTTILMHLCRGISNESASREFVPVHRFSPFQSLPGLLFFAEPVAGRAPRKQSNPSMMAYQADLCSRRVPGDAAAFLPNLPGELTPDRRAGSSRDFFVRKFNVDTNLPLNRKKLSKRN